MRGKVKRQQTTAPPGQDHPRICREKKCPKAWCIGQQGSSPHMRGKVGAVVQLRAGAGITPAYAGKRRPRRFRWGSGKDHPRICGEKAVLLIRSCHALGSPPHMRGKGHDGLYLFGCIGITPAYAGKSASPQVTSRQVLGSPPRMRGKGRPARLDDLRHRITPAYAGKRIACESVSGRPEDHPRVCGEKRGQAAVFAVREGSPPHMRGKAAVHLAARVGPGITPAYAGKSLLC